MSTHRGGCWWSLFILISALGLGLIMTTSHDSQEVKCPSQAHTLGSDQV